MGKPEGKRPLGRPRRRWDDNIKMYLQEVGWKGMDWIDLAVDMGSCERGSKSLGSINWGGCLDQLGNF